MTHKLLNFAGVAFNPRSCKKSQLNVLSAGALHFDEELGEFLLAFGLVVAAFGVGELGDVHRTEFRPAHGAELCFLIEVVGQILVVHGFGGRGIERKLELLVPVEEEARVAESVVAIPSAGAVTRDVGGVGGDLVCDDALFHVFRIRQAEVFFRRDIAKHRWAVPTDHRGADGAGDVVVAWGDVDDERAERVKRRFVAPLHFLVDLFFDLVEWNVAGAFDHDLDVFFPGFFGEFAENFEFGELFFVAGIGDAAGTQAVSKGKAHVVLFEDLDDAFDVFVEEVLLFVMLHPMGHQRAAAADDTGDALADERNVFAQDARVDGHVVDALLGLLFDDFEHEVEGEIFGAANAGNRFVNRNGADRNGRGVDDGLANFGNVAAGAEVHHGVGAVVEGVMELFQFFVDVGGGGGIADVGVDFAAGGDADSHGLEIPVVNVGGDDAAAAGDFAADDLGIEFFALGDVLHFLGDDAFTGEVHLRHVAVAVGAGLSGFP